MFELNLNHCKSWRKALLGVLSLVAFSSCNEDAVQEPPLQIELMDSGSFVGQDHGMDLSSPDMGSTEPEEMGAQEMDMALDEGEDLEHDMPPIEDMSDLSDMPDMATPSGSGLCQQGASISWSAGEPLKGPGRDHHTTFINYTTNVPPQVHVIGGNNYAGVFDDHWSAVILEDGTLGSWAGQPKLAQAAAGSAYATSHGRHYIMGGRARPILSTVQVSYHDENNAILGWLEQLPLPQPRFHGSGAATNDYLYFSGGVSGTGDVQSDLFIGKLSASGNIESWQTQTLPEPRSHHASFVHDSYLYLVQGFSGNPFQNATNGHRNIVRAPIDPQTGLVGDWEVFLEEDVDISTLSVSLDDGSCACRIAGLVKEGSNYSYSKQVQCYNLDGETQDTILSQPINASLQLGRSHVHHAPYHNGRYYIVGGSKGYQDVVQDVEIGTVMTAP